MLQNLNNTALGIIEKEIEKNVLDLRNESSTFEFFENIGIPLNRSNKQILSAEINRFKGKLINTLLKHVVKNTRHKETDAGREVLYNFFDFEL